MRNTLFIVLVTALSLAGCGKKDDGIPNPNPAPAPSTPVVNNPTVNGTNCPQLGGGTLLSSLPFIGALRSQTNYNYQWLNQLSSITLSASIISSVGYTYQNNNIIGSGSISLAELSSLYQNTSNNSIPSACIASPSGAQTTTSTGYFYNGQVSSLVLTGSIPVPYYSPFQWGGYGSPGSSPTMGQQLIQVIVGSRCATSFIPSYGNTAGRIRGCISVRMGDQPNSQTLHYQSQ